MNKIRVRVRAARQDEAQRLQEFYLATETDTLPPPSLATLAGALTNGSLLIVEDCGDDAILATAGYFEYIKSQDGHLIFELAGTRVTSAIGRLNPFPLQQILLALRIVQVVATEKSNLSVISSARHASSKANLMALKFEEIAEMPAWLQYDVCSWTQRTQRQEWRHFIAPDASIDRAIEILTACGFSEQGFACQSTRRLPDSEVETVSVFVEYDMALSGAIFLALVEARSRNTAMCRFVPLPPAV